MSIDRSASVRLAGLFRLPFTYNTKTGRKNSGHIRKTDRYSLRQMIASYAPAEYNPHKKGHSPRHWAAAEESSVVPEQEYVPLAELDAEAFKGGKAAIARRVQHLVRLRALRKASIGNSEDCIGEDYKAVVAHFEAAGFDNIELIDLDNSGLLFWKKGTVSQVSIAGKIHFESVNYFFGRALVLVQNRYLFFFTQSPWKERNQGLRAMDRIGERSIIQNTIKVQRIAEL